MPDVSAVELGLSALSLLVLLPVGAIIWLIGRSLNYSILKGGRIKVLIVTGCFIISIAGAGYGLWRVFTEFSLIWFFVAVGGGIAFILSLNATLMDKADLKRQR